MELIDSDSSAVLSFLMQHVSIQMYCRLSFLAREQAPAIFATPAVGLPWRSDVIDVEPWFSPVVLGQPHFIVRPPVRQYRVTWVRFTEKFHSKVLTLINRILIIEWNEDFVSLLCCWVEMKSWNVRCKAIMGDVNGRLNPVGERPVLIYHYPATLYAPSGRTRMERLLFLTGHI